MYTMMLMINGQAQALLLQYRTDAAAKKALHDATSEGWHTCELTDDYGRTISFSRAKVDVALMQDVETALGGDRAAQLLQARSQAKLQAAVQSDPGMRAAAQVMDMARGPMGRQ